MFVIAVDADRVTWGVACGAALRELERRIAASERKLKAASAARQALPAGSSRTRVTTANARYGIAAEAHDRNIRARRVLLEAREQ